VVSGSVLECARALRAALSGFDAALVGGGDCARLVEELAVTEKACAAVRVLAAVRAVESGSHRERGFHDGVKWLARQSGSTAGQARQALSTAGRLGGCPDTRAAWLAGELSVSQAAEIAETAAQVPGAEAELLAAAGESDLSELRDRARECVQARVDPAGLRARQVRAREFRHWRDREGMVRFAGALPPETGLALVRRVELAAVRARRAARAGGADKEPFDAYAVDALAALVAGSGEVRARSSSTGAELVIVCDLFAWRRGHPHPGEVCHIIGGGPIPVEVARELSRDAFVKAVLHDGTAIHTVKHFGRYLNATLRTALDLGPVPQFSGRACVDCGSRWGLQYDHVDPVAHQGPTEYANLKPRCWKDHQAKTERDRQAGLLGPHPPRPPNTP
jgi:HNH endonuclease